MVQYLIKRWRRNDVTHETAHDLFSAQPRCDEARVAHRAKSKVAIGFDRDVEQDSGTFS
jgi:hypothetical protein